MKIIFLIIFLTSCNTFDKSGFVVIKGNSKVNFKNAEITNMHTGLMIEQKNFYIYIEKKQIEEIYIVKKIK